MGLFGRRRKAAEPEPADLDQVDDSDVEDGADLDDTDESEDTYDADELDEDLDDGGDLDVESATPFDRSDGPFDRSEVEAAELESHIDLGALLLPAREGMQLRLELDEATQTVTGAQVMSGESIVQIQVYAAPRTLGVWHEIRQEIAQAVVTDNKGTAEITDGPLGRQVVAVLPDRRRMRFLGVDGPRWFLRAVLSGKAASDDAAAASLIDIVRGSVVVRGSEAMAPRELLPLTLPVVEQPAEAEPTAASTHADSDSGGADESEGSDDGSAARAARSRLKPFERGPEITEVR